MQLKGPVDLCVPTDQVFRAKVAGILAAARTNPDELQREADSRRLPVASLLTAAIRGAASGTLAEMSIAQSDAVCGLIGRFRASPEIAAAAARWLGLPGPDDLLTALIVGSVAA